MDSINDWATKAVADMLRRVVEALAGQLRDVARLP